MAYKNKATYKAWCDKNRIKLRKYQKDYQRKRRKLYPEKQREADKKWKQNHQDKYKSAYLKKAKHRIRFLGKQIFIGFRQLTGYCSHCPNNIFDGKYKRTEMHHLKYIPCMPWACRIELCIPCHRKTRIGQKYRLRCI